MKKKLKLLNNYEDLKNIRSKFKNKKIGLCHGGFDIFHIGHLNHLKEAKDNCDLLIVSITAGNFISKSPSLPYNSDQSRLEMLKSIEIVDYVFLDHSISAISVLKSLKPNIYFKGKDYSINNNDYVGNLKSEISFLKKNKIKFYTTKSKLFSSSKIFLNNYSNLENYQKKYIKKFREKYLLANIIEEINKIKSQTVNIFGETIEDKFKFIKILGLASKFPIYSGHIKFIESYPGGTLAVANSALEFTKKVNLITAINKKKIPKDFLKRKFNLINVPNINHQIKTRYLNEYRYERFFQLANVNEVDLSSNQDFFLKVLKKINNKSTNLIMDYGIWKNKSKILDVINLKKRKYFLNVQTNSQNLGNNLIDKYKNYDFCSLDYREFCVNLGLPVSEFKYTNEKSYKNIKNLFYKNFKKNNTIIVVTLGKNGSVVFNKDIFFYCPVFISSTVDTTGCGDVFYLMFSLLIKNHTSIELAQFISTAYAGLHSLFIGNKKVVEKIELFKYLNFLYKL